MSELTDAKALLVREITDLLTEHHPERRALVLDHEPVSVKGFTVTVATAGYLPDRIELTIRIYADLTTAAAGQRDQDDVIALLSDDLSDEWSEPRWAIGWDERTDMFIAEGNTTYLRPMV